MRKTILALCAVLGLSVGASAQEFNFGVEGGLSYNRLSMKADLSQIDPAIFNGMWRIPVAGGYIGGFAEMTFDSPFSVRGDLYFAQQGFGARDSDAAYWCVSNNFMIPVLGQFRIADFLTLGFGPELGVIVNGRDYYYWIGQRFSDNVKWSKKTYNHVEFLLQFSAEFRIGESFGIQLKYDLGLTNVKIPTLIDPSAVRNQQRSLMLGVCWHFDTL